MAKSSLGSNNGQLFILSKHFLNHLCFEFVVKLCPCAMRKIERQVAISQLRGNQSPVQRKTDRQARWIGRSQSKGIIRGPYANQLSPGLRAILASHECYCRGCLPKQYSASTNIKRLLITYCHCSQG